MLATLFFKRSLTPSEVGLLITRTRQLRYKYFFYTLYRGLLPDKDIVDIKDDQVTFRYIDSQTNPDFK